MANVMEAQLVYESVTQNDRGFRKPIHRCGNCRHSRPDVNMNKNRRICREGYGVRHKADKGCRVWEGA